MALSRAHICANAQHSLSTISETHPFAEYDSAPVNRKVALTLRITTKIYFFSSLDH